jgi:hypothetical protein
MSGTNWHGGKGSKARPISNREQFESNWDRIFGMKDNENTKRKSEREKTPTVGQRPTN